MSSYLWGWPAAGVSIMRGCHPQRAQLASFCMRQKSSEESLVLLIVFPNGEPGVFEAAVSFHFAINFSIVIPMECYYLVVGGRSLT